MSRNPVLLDRKRTGLLVVDIQEKILAVMAHPDRVVKNSVKLIKGFKTLGCPIFITEQYPKGMGKTAKPIKDALGDVKIPDKLTFSCCGVEGLTRSILSKRIDQIVLCGIESHVCVWQTAMDLLYKDFNVSVVSDALSSRKDEDHEAALGRMGLHGIEVTTTETVLFELLKEAGTDEFKVISKLVK
jgi:nicotinamidase-related amidase